jgi:hypothetical protein
MAVPTTIKPSFSKIGVPSIVSEIDLNENGTVAKRAVGFKVEDQQGNVYRWCHFGATTTQGLLVSSDLSESSLVDSDNIVVVPASTVSGTDGAAGSKYVEITLAATTVNQYAGGKLIITDDAGEGYTYNIVGNSATGDPASGNIRVELERPIVVALTAASDIGILPNQYANLEPATTTDIDVVGVSMASMAANDYGWVMTKGSAAILDQGTTTIGAQIMIGSDAGSVTDLTSSSVLGLNGFTVIAGDNTGYAGIRFNFE